MKGLALAQSADVRNRVQREGVRVINGTARFCDDRTGLAAHRVAAVGHDGTTEVLDADVVLIATGATPRVLPGAEPDGERILDWRQIYDLPELPEHLVVVGSGVTGAEFVSAYTEMGVRVTLVSSRDRVLPHEDADAAAVLEDVFAARGTEVVKHARAERVERTDKGVRRAPARRPDRRGQPRADDRRLGAQHRRPRAGQGRHRAGRRAGSSRSTGCRGRACPASTRPATAPAC